MPREIHRIAARHLRSIAVGYGAGHATDRIMVDGARVGYCYREEPDFDVDSGWRFFAGDESQDYADNPDNWGLYDINTIANHDPEITVVLESPIGSVFERNEVGQLIATDGSTG